MLTQSPSLSKFKKPLKPLTDHRSQTVLKKPLSRKTLENSLKSSNLLGVSATARAHTQIQEDNSMTTKLPLNTSNLIASPRSNLVRKPGRPGTLLKLGRRSPAKNSLAELDLSKAHNQTEAHSRDYSLERSLSPLKGDKSASSALDLGLLPEKRKMLKPLVMAGALNLREELEKEVDASPLCKVDKSAMFYDTIKHLDDCGKCFTSCRKHHKSPFGVDYRGPKESVYRRDFSPAAAQMIQTDPSSTMISSQIYESPKPKYGVPINSTSRNDFRAWDSNLVKDKGPANSLGLNNGSYFLGKSTYNASYYDYGTPKVMEDLRNYSSSAALDLPFTGKSLYQKDFSGLDLANSPKKIERKERSPLPLGSIFLGETSNARLYKNYNVSPVPSTLARRDNDEEYDGGTKAYLNQYKSVYGKDFTPKLEPKCPANHYAETHDVPRLRKPLPRHNV